MAARAGERHGSLEDECGLGAAGLPFDATPEVRDALARVGRTEDLRFSPSNRRLAVAGFGRDAILVFDVEIVAAAGRLHVGLTGGTEVRSGGLAAPHGLDFLTEDMLLVANRNGGVSLVRLAPDDGRNLPTDVR